MKLNRSNSYDSEHALVSLDERDLADLDRLLAKLRGPRPSTIGSTDPGEQEAAHALSLMSGLRLNASDPAKPAAERSAAQVERWYG